MKTLLTILSVLTFAAGCGSAPNMGGAPTTVDPAESTDDAAKPESGARAQDPVPAATTEPPIAAPAESLTACTVRLCAARARTCGLLQFAAGEGCGIYRTIDCGQCTGTDVCGGGGVDGQCSNRCVDAARDPIGCPGGTYAAGCSVAYRMVSVVGGSVPSFRTDGTDNCQATNSDDEGLICCQ